MKTLVITLAIIGMLLMTSCLALADDKSDKLNQESGYTFSPGYINAAKYQAESLLKVKIPDYKEKGFFEKAVEYVKAKVGNNAKQQQASSQNLNPVLQQKTSGTSGNNTANFATSLLGGISLEDNGDPNVTAYVRNSVQESLNKNGITARDMDVKFLNGRYCVLWTEQGSNSNNSLKFQAFDSSGKAYTTAISITENASNIANVARLSNGNLAVFWDEYGQSGYPLRYQIFDTGGVAQSSIVNVSSDDRWVYAGGNVTQLSNGNIAAFWNAQDSNGNNFLKYQAFDFTGKASTGIVNLGGNGGLVDASITKSAQLNNGNIALFYRDKNGYSLKCQVFNPNAPGASSIQYTFKNTTYANISDVEQLANGNIAVLYTEGNTINKYSLKCEILDPSGKMVSSYTVRSNSTLILYTYVDAVQLANGNIAVFYTENNPDWRYSLQGQIFDPSGKASSISYTVTKNCYWAAISSVTQLANGNIVIFWNDSSPNGMYTKYQVLTSSGSALSAANVITRNTYGLEFNVTQLSDGNVVVFYSQFLGNSGTYMTQIIDSAGTVKSSDVLKTPPPITSLGDLGRTIINNSDINPLKLDGLNSRLRYSVSKLNTFTGGFDVSGIFGALLANKEALPKGQGTPIDPQLIMKMAQDALKGSVVAVPGGQLDPKVMEIAMKLASILSNPTEDQKVVIDSVTSLLNDIENLQKETGTNPELAKASSDLLQMVANVLLSQAIPDLLKEGDMQGIKGIFSQLDSSKSKVILEYKEATKPYYEEVKKLIEKNASAIDIDINLKKLFEKEVPRSDIDKILEKLKNKAQKTFEEEYILQQEEKAKAKYIDPNKKKLENDMRKMLEDFTKKLSMTLEAKK